MSDRERFVRPPSSESMGEAPGRGRLDGRRILVVGGGQRIVDAATDPVGNGRAMSLLFAREGAHVGVADKNEDSADETVDMILKEGGRAFAIEADITDEAHVNRIVQQARVGLGGLDGLVLNVGIGAGALGLGGVKVEDWDLTLATNLRGPMLCCRDALPVLDEGSSIVFISSIAGITSGSRLPAYDVSKAALGGLMRHVAREGAPAASERTSSLRAWSTRLSAGSRPRAARRARRRTCPSVVRRRRGRSRTRRCSSCPTRASTSPGRRSPSTAASQAFDGSAPLTALPSPAIGASAAPIGRLVHHFPPAPPGSPAFGASAA